MSIEIRDMQDFDRDRLQELFLSVEWDSGNYPERLQEAIRRSHSVFSAWDGDQLVGLANALSDGIMTAYVHYVLVRPEYQGAGVGRMLLERLKEHYADLPRIVLVSYDRQVGFYQRLGFTPGAGKTPMFLTYLRT